MKAEERQSQIRSAARSVFLEEGYSGVTMGMIAKRAGLSRPALYQDFNSKKEIFLAATDDLLDEGWERVMERAAEASDLAAHLDAVLEGWIHWAHEIATRYDSGRELIHEGAKLTGGLLDAFYERLAGHLSSKFVEHKDEVRIPSESIPFERQAALFLSSARGMKKQAAGRRELRQQTADLIAMITLETP